VHGLPFDAWRLIEAITLTGCSTGDLWAKLDELGE
jgi:hypothetical protein